MVDLPPKYDPIGATTRLTAEATNDPLIADAPNYEDGFKDDHMLCAGSSRQGARGLRGSDLTSAAHPADDQAADANHRA
jgi:hypothetical protein